MWDYTVENKTKKINVNIWNRQWNFDASVIVNYVLQETPEQT